MEGGLGILWLRFGSAIGPYCGGDKEGGGDDLWFEFLLQMTWEGGGNGQGLEWQEKLA